MPNLIDPKLGRNERPSEGLRQSVNAGEEPPVDADEANDGSEEGEMKEDHPGGKKRGRSPSVQEQRSSKKIKGPDSSFATMRAPARTISCVISINEREPFGSLYRADDCLAIVLFMDPGRYGPPAISLSFRKAGADTDKGIAKNVWDVKSNLRGEWAMSHVEHGYAEPNGPHTPDGRKTRMSNPAVLAQCASQDIGQLMYMRFKSWSHVMGFNRTGSLRGQSQEIRKSMEIMFRRAKPYLIELWFVAPYNATEFRRNCLRFFTMSMENRLDPFEQWRDSNGVYFNDLSSTVPLPTTLNGALAGAGQVKPSRVPATTRPKRLPEPAPPGNQAEQSAVGRLTPTAVQDARMSDLPTSPPPKTRPAPELQTMLTFGAGPLPPPAQDQRATAIDFSFSVKASMSSRIHEPDEDFVPESMLGLLGVEDNNSELMSDSDAGSDRESQHGGQREGDDRDA